MKTNLTRSQWNPILLGLMALEGVLTLAATMRVRSEPGSAFLFGYSLPRLAIAAAALAGVLLLTGLALAAWNRPAVWQRAAGAVGRFTKSSDRLFAVFAGLFGLFLALAAFLILSISPAALELVFLRSWLERVGLLLVWAELILLQLWLLAAFNRPPALAGERFFTPARMASLLGIATVIYVLALRVFTSVTWDLRMRRIEEYIFLPAAVFLVWGVLQHFYGQRGWYPRASRYFFLAAIGLVTYTLYRHTSQWLDWQGTPSKAYWHQLADAFLQGHLYLTNPGSTHDLTLYNGRWYVPNPPLPALVLLPFVALLGAQNISMVTFSIACGAINAVLIYLVLEQASLKGLIPTGRNANLWLTAVVAFSTDQWWLAVSGRMWFLSQTLTLLFAAIALLFALKRWSPWLVGTSLGLALLARPNVFTLWPLLAGITIYLDECRFGRYRWKAMLAWAVQSAVPVCLAAAGLLFYNRVRFDNWMDFGYVTINGAAGIVAAVQTYGMFNLHFIPINFKVMFLDLPGWSLNGGCLAFRASTNGFSILAMTPAIVYAVRRIRFSAWTAGAWLATLLSILLLLLYHNTGADQVGYRYILDFILPLMLLAALGVGHTPMWVFKLLVLAGVLVNAVGLLWYFNRWVC